jgi:hypothetical protein
VREGGGVAYDTYVRYISTHNAEVTDPSRLLP